MAKMTYKSIPNDAIIDIKVSGSFYLRLVELLNSLGESVPLDEFKDVLEKIKDDKPAGSLFEFNVHTILMMIYEVEKEALSQNKAKDEEIEVPDESTDSSLQQGPQSAQ
jgi:hypothetical protein